MNNFLYDSIASCVELLTVKPQKTMLLPLNAVMQNYELLINTLIVVAVIVLLVFLVVIYNSFQSLKESTQQSNKTGARWINQKLYDFDGEQLTTLIKKIKKVNKNDQHI